MPTDPHAQTLAQRLSDEVLMRAVDAGRDAANEAGRELAHSGMHGHEIEAAITLAECEGIRAVLLAALAPEPVSGTRADCIYCMKPGHVYRHSGGYNWPMCDACRDSSSRQTPEPVTPPPSVPAETQEQRLHRILNEPEIPVTVLPDGSCVPASPSAPTVGSLPPESDLPTELRLRVWAGNEERRVGGNPYLVVLLRQAAALLANTEINHRHDAGAIADLTHRLHVAEQERDALRTALRLLLRYVNSTNESRWGEWASRLFRDPDEYVNLKMVQDALRDVEKIAEAR